MVGLNLALSGDFNFEAFEHMRSVLQKIPSPVPHLQLHSEV